MIKADDGFLKAKLEIAKVVTELSVDELIHLECRLLAAIYGEAVGVDPKHIKITRRIDPELGKVFDVKIYGKTMEALPEDKAFKLTTRCFFKIGRQRVE
ncbi:conserved domain protein [Peptoniphilus sp. oral taxon 375 str. F0436]|nr:conserved domain protein [Peptoniphilus sp. oral taxon 375 str. F0436]